MKFGKEKQLNYVEISRFKRIKSNLEKLECIKLIKSELFEYINYNEEFLLENSPKIKSFY